MGTRGNNKNFSIIGDNRQFLVERSNGAILFLINDSNSQAQSYFGTNLQVAGISTFSSTIHVGHFLTGIGVTINSFAGSGQASFSGIVTAGQLDVTGNITGTNNLLLDGNVNAQGNVTAQGNMNCNGGRLTLSLIHI